MLSQTTLDSDSDAKVALSDPFAVNGEALYLNQENSATAVDNTTTNGSIVKPASNIKVKKTYHAATVYRQSVAKAAMAPPPVQNPGRVPSTTEQHMKPAPTDASSRVTKAPRVPKPFPRLVNGLPRVHPAVSLVPSSDLLPSNVSSIQAPLAPATAVKRSAPHDSEDETPCNGAAAQRTRPENNPTQPFKAVNGAQGLANGNTNDGPKDARPKKRRRVSTEQEENLSVPQGAANQPISTSSAPPDSYKDAIDNLLAPKDTLETSKVPNNGVSAAIKSEPTTAFQKYAVEHSAISQSRKAHWSTCSMETWLAGGEEIADRFSKLLNRGVCMFETNVIAFESIDQTFDEYKKEVLGNRDNVLRQAKDTIMVASSTLLGGTPSGAEAAP